MIHPSKTVVLDGDILCYKAASAVQQVTEWDEDTVSVSFDKPEGVRCLSNMVSKVFRCLEAAGLPKENALFALSCRSEDNFRRALWPDYKTNRSGAQRPIGLKAMRDPHLISEALPEGSKVVVREFLEADDVLGIMLSKGYLCLSDDKDLGTCPGLLGKLSPDDSGNLRIRQVSVGEATRFLALQTLAGDSTDGIPGCPKIGLKTAEKLLASWDPGDAPLWENIVATYEKAKLTREDALRTFRMVFILREKTDNLMTNPEDHLTWDLLNQTKGEN